MSASTYCCNCHQSKIEFETAVLPYLCDQCGADPYRLSLLSITNHLVALVESNYLTSDTFRVIVADIISRKNSCDTNPAPVVVGLVFTELYDDGGKVLLVQRAIEPQIGGWALVSGYVIDTLSWQENLRKEVKEEASVVVSTKKEDMYPFYFASNLPRTNLLLNFAVVLPQGVVRILDFTPDHETLARQEFRFTRDVRPDFCFSIHQTVFDAFCAQHFGW